MLLLDEPLYRRVPSSIPVLVRSYTRSLLALLGALALLGRQTSTAMSEAGTSCERYGRDRDIINGCAGVGCTEQTRETGVRKYRQDQQ